MSEVLKLSIVTSIPCSRITGLTSTISLIAFSLPKKIVFTSNMSDEAANTAGVSIGILMHDEMINVTVMQLNVLVLLSDVLRYIINKV